MKNISKFLIITAFASMAGAASASAVCNVGWSGANCQLNVALCTNSGGQVSQEQCVCPGGKKLDKGACVTAVATNPNTGGTNTGGTITTNCTKNTAITGGTIAKKLIYKTTAGGSSPYYLYSSNNTRATATVVDSSGRISAVGGTPYIYAEIYAGGGTSAVQAREKAALDEITASLRSYRVVRRLDCTGYTTTLPALRLVTY